MYSLFGKGLSTKDTSALKQYISELQKGATISKAANATLNGTSAAAKNVAKQLGQLTLDFRAGRITEEAYTEKMKALEGEMVATSAKAQMLGGVLRTVLNVGLTLLISTLVSLPNIIKNISDSIKQERQEAADSAKQQIDDINDLRTQYYELSEQVKTDSSVKEQLTTVTKQLLKRLGLEKQAIEDLSDDYERLNGNINEATISSLQEAESSLRSTIADNSSVEDKNFSTNGGYIVSDKFGKKTIQTVSALKEYREIVNDLQKEFSNFDFQDSMITFDVSNIDTIKQSYQDVSDLLAYMNEEYGDNTQQSTLYHSLAAIQTELKTDIDKYDTAVSNLNDNIAQQTILTGLIGREIPKTTEDFEKFKQELIDSIYYTNEEGETVTKFAGITQDNMELAENAILSFLSTMPEFKKFFEIGSDDGNNGSSLQSKLSGLNSELESLKETTDSAFSNQSTLQSAFDKIQEGASLSADEVRKLVEICPELATEFDKTADGYTISSDALINANDNIIQSTKESVEAQIKGYQEVIDKYNEIKNVVGMPESARQDRLKALGITEDDIENAEQQINQLRLILGMLGITLGEDASQAEKLKEKYEELSKTGSTLSSKMKFLSSAFKEQKENGQLSADTILSIIENGYAAVLMYDKETGKVKLNEQAYLNLAEAELAAYEADLQTQISNAELQLLDAKRSIVSNLGWSYLDTAEAALKLAEAEAIINNNPELIDNLKGQLLAVQELRGGLGSVVTGEYGDSGSGSSSSDLTKDAYTEKQKELKHLLEMEKITQAQYYEMLFGSDEYKALLANRTKYLDELNSIDEEYYKYQQNLYKENADKQFDDLEDQYKRGIITAEQYAQGLHDLGQELYGEDSIYGGTEFAIKALEELDKKVKETSEDIYDESLDSLKKNNDGTLKSEEQFIKDWTKLNDDTWKTINPKEWEENYNEIADYTQDFYKDLLDKGVLNPDQYKDKVQSFFYRLKSMGIDLGKNWLADALEIDDIEYDKLKESLSADGDRTLDDVLADAEKLSEKNIKLFSDDPETLRKNAEDIFKSVSESAKDALDKMLITPDEYLQIIDKWGDNLNISKGLLEEAKELSEDDYLERWDLDNGYDENKSKDDYELRAKRIEYIYELAEQLYGKNGQKNLKAYNALVNQGLEDVESLVEDYYDEEIKKLEEINDEEEKRQKALELQLNLIKARQKLEEAKNNRNQLVFHNGTFEYMADQDAVISAGEDLAEAQKAILEQEREDQKEALENQKEETLKFFNSVGGKLDDFIDRVKKFLSGDKDAFKVDEKDNTGDDFNSKMQKEWGLGNVDLTKRPKVKMDDGSIATVLSSGAFIWQGDEENGKYVYVHVTPILPDGTVLDDKTLDDYLYNTLEGSNNILETDKNGKGLVLKVDDNLGLSEEDIKSIENGNWTDNVKALVDKFDEWDVGLHNIQEQWLEQSESKNANSSKGVEIKADNVEAKADTNTKPVVDTTTVTDVTDTVTTEEPDATIESIVTNIDANVVTISETAKDIFDVAKAFADGFNFENLVRALGGNPTAESVKNFQDSYNATLVGKQIVPSGLPSNITNNSSTTNNASKVINVGGITVKLELTVQSLNDFVNNKIGEAMTKFGNAIEQEMPIILAKA